MKAAAQAAAPSVADVLAARLAREAADPGATGSVAGVIDLIGRTPLLELSRIDADAPRATVLAKLECRNPGGSVKDRTALGMLLDAQATGRIGPDSLVVEPTAGNTGIGLALVGRALGLRVVLVMPERYSQEKARVAVALGARLVGVPGPTAGMRECIDVARDLAAREGGCVLNQFDNPANPAIHEVTTGPEIWAQCGGRLDAVVFGVGTGGTFTGVVRHLRRHVPELVAHAVVPRGSILGGGTPGATRLEGIGGTFVPATFDVSLATAIVPVDDEEALVTTRALARDEGILSGGSGGAILCAALRLARRLGPGARIVTLVPDWGERYWSKGLWEPSS